MNHTWFYTTVGFGVSRGLPHNQHASAWCWCAFKQAAWAAKMAGWCSKVACGDGVKGRGKASNISGFQSFQSSSVGSIMFYRFSCLRIRFSSALQVASWSLLASIWQLWRLHQDTPGTFGGNLGQYRGKQRKLHTKSGYHVLSIMVWSNPVYGGLMVL